LSNLHKHALTEFKAAGWIDDNGYTDEMQGMICNHVMKLIDVFSEEGHSGSTAPYAINMFQKLASFKPLTPLTGEDDEWIKHDYGVDPIYQNKRHGSVFKDANGDAYDSDGKVFWEWCKRQLDTDEEGYPGERVYKSYYSCRESRVPVTFPYTVPDKPIYEYRHSDAIPQQPPQNEDGFL
jgi:hypothetical protein